jgi:hypothetical protein
MSDQNQQRKDDTRRKIIAGAIALEYAQYDHDFAASLAALLNEKIIKPADRAVFDFLPEQAN